VGEVTTSVAEFEFTSRNVALIRAVPALRAVASPSDPKRLLIDATDGSEEIQAASEVMSRFVPLEKTPSALYWSEAPRVIVSDLGVTEIESRVGAATVSTADPAAFRKVAVIRALPSATESARPDPLTTATAGFSELHATNCVKSWVSSFANTPCAVNCLLFPWTTVLLEGVIRRDATSADVRAVVAVSPLNVADIIVVPRVLVPMEKTPLPGDVAIAASDELQTAEFEKSCIAVFSRMPIAWNRLLVPGTVVTFEGVTASEARGETVATVEPLTVPEVAVMVAVPELAIALSTPAWLTSAIEGSDELQLMPSVRTRESPFEKKPVACIRTDVPGARLTGDGLTASAISSPVVFGDRRTSSISPIHASAKSRRKKMICVRRRRGPFVMLLISDVRGVLRNALFTV
jgi:hypothetical protein